MATAAIVVLLLSLAVLIATVATVPRTMVRPWVGELLARLGDELDDDREDFFTAESRTEERRRKIDVVAANVDHLTLSAVLVAFCISDTRHCLTAPASTVDPFAVPARKSTADQRFETLVVWLFLLGSWPGLVLTVACVPVLLLAAPLCSFSPVARSQGRDAARRVAQRVTTVAVAISEAPQFERYRESHRPASRFLEKYTLHQRRPLAPR